MIDRRKISISEDVLKKIVSNMPYLTHMIEKLKESEGTPMVGALEKHIANNVFMHSIFLSGPEV